MARDERKAVTQVKGWRQFALFPRAEIKALTLSRREWIKQRLREESRQSAQEGAQERRTGPEGPADGAEDPPASQTPSCAILAERQEK